MDIADKYYCNYCDKLVGQKGFSYHLKKLHNIKFLDYVKENLVYFPQYHNCQICNKNITTGKSCSRKCASILQIRRQTGRVGWSKGLTKDTHSGLNSMAEKARVRLIGRNIWNEMSDDTKIEAKKKISDKTKARVSGVGNPMFGKTHSADIVRKIFSYRNYTKPEKIIKEFLDNNNIEYYFQYFITDTSTYSYDFKIKNKNLIIEVDGDYWHGGPGVTVYHRSVTETKLRDILKTKLANERGIEVLRIWSSDIKSNISAVKNLILDSISKIN